MHAEVQPTRTTDAGVLWELRGHRVEVVRRGTRWLLTRSWTDDEMELLQQPIVGVAFGLGDAVAHLATPVGLAPGQRIGLWLEWPLEIVVRVASGAVEGPPVPRRRTLLGRVSDGRVLPAAITEVLDGPASASPGCGAVRVELENASSAVAVLRRCPIVEAELSVFRAGETLAGGTVQVRVGEGQRAEASSSALAAPEGFESVPRPTPSAVRGRLNWLLDGTRRSAEFRL